MTRLDKFDFKIPEHWLQHDDGSKCYPSDISNWFPMDFHFYFRYEHPILIDPKFLPDEFKLLLKELFWTDYYQFSLPAFLRNFFPAFSDKKTFEDFLLNKPFDTLPEYVFGQIKGNQMNMSEIAVPLKCLVSQNENVVINYNDLRNGILLNADYIDTYFKTSTEDLLSLKDKTAPNYILQENKSWCITTPYDNYFSVIACNETYAESLRNKENIGIFEMANTQT